MGGVLGEGDVVRTGVYEAGGGLAGAGVGIRLAGEEAHAFEVGGAGAEVVSLAHGLDDAAGRRAAGAGVQVGEVVVGEGGEVFAGEVRGGDGGSFFESG